MDLGFASPSDGPCAGRALAGALAWLLVGAAACAGPGDEGKPPPERTGQARAAIHSSHAGSPPWPHVLTCYGGCQAPYYDPSACNHPTSCGPIADGTWWYATERAAFYCGAKLKLERGDLCVVVDVEDNGPADWVEDEANATCGTPYIIDTSPLVADYFGGGCGWSECFMVDVSPVPDDTPTGPAGCEVCECAAGDQENEDCGYCGTRSRSCGSDCQWSPWSDCDSQGACEPQATETEPCCDCGERTRTCSADCSWGDWSLCAGPDPDGGQTACDTGLEPPCDTGTVRCVDGCVSCRSDRHGEPELCDGSDNDCNGYVDDGGPLELGDPPPPYAARLVEVDVPTELSVDTLTSGSARFENAGAEPWPAGEVWLARVDADGTVASALRAPSWLSAEVATQTVAEVWPGAATTVSFELLGPPTPGPIEEELRLLAPDGRPMRCPGPGVELALTVRDGPPGSEHVAAGEPPTTIVGECACTLIGADRSRAMPPTAWLVVPALAAARDRRRRRKGVCR